MPPFLFLELQSKSGLRKIQHNQLLWCYNLTELQVLQHLWKTGFYCRTIMSCSSVSTQHFMTVYQEKHISHDSWDSGWGTMLRLTLSFYSRKKKRHSFYRLTALFTRWTNKLQIMPLHMFELSPICSGSLVRCWNICFLSLKWHWWSRYCCNWVVLKW